MSSVLNFVELRSGKPADLPIIDTIMNNAFDPRYGEAWTRAQCMSILAMPGVWLTIAAMDGEPAGFALVRAAIDEAELLLLATHPRMRRRGIGGALLRSTMHDAKDRNINYIFLEVRSDNEAIKLYQSFGFVQVGERRAYYRSPNGQLYNALTLRCQLQ